MTHTASSGCLPPVSLHAPAVAPAQLKIYKHCLADFDNFIFYFYHNDNIAGQHACVHVPDSLRRIATVGAGLLLDVE